MDHYDSLEQIEETFCTFMGLVGEDGTVIVCGEDPRLDVYKRQRTTRPFLDPQRHPFWGSQPWEAWKRES